MIPRFEEEDGCLPRGEHSASWRELAERFGFSARRRKLLAGLLIACRSFRDAGCKVMLVDGSFVTAKRNPKDYDCCYPPQGVSSRQLDPVLLDFGDRSAMKIRYSGEFLPWGIEIEEPMIPFIGTIRDFFQRRKEDIGYKGVVLLDLGTLP